jgi:tetratricopeptide (TPR) repeat protein/transcriptional regulator with XRE-family HTH domain
MDGAFAGLLKGYRLAAGLTQEALAERAGVAWRTISDLERGVKHPRRDTVALLAEALALTGDQRPAFAAASRAHSVSQASAPAPYGEVPAWSPRASQATTLVGRASELTLLDRHLAGQGPPLLFLTGQPGIGKSRLLQEAAGRATARGWRVLAGGCTRGGGQQPFAPLLQALQRHLAGRAHAERQLDLRGCAWLIRLLPELAADEIDPLPGWTLPPEQERRLMFDAARRFLANVALPSGALLLLDDLHWAGADAFDLLAGLLHQPPAAPLRVVAAARDTDMPPEHPLSVTLAELAEAQLVAPQPVRPLTPQEAQALVAQLLGEQDQRGAALAARVAQRTGGVPFFLVSYAHSLESRDAAEEAAPGVPWDVRQSIVRRVTALPEAARALLAVTAVVGRVAPRTLLLAVLEQPERDLPAALEGACRSGLLEEVGEDAYGFVHDVIREVVEAELGLARRRQLHRQVAEALERAPGKASVEALAFHFRQAGEPARAAIYLEQAGDQATAQFAHAAADHYRDLVTCVEGLGREPDLQRAREKLGGALVRMARYDAALAVLDQVTGSLQRAGDLAGLARVETQIAGIHSFKGAFPAGIDRLRPVVATLESSGPSAELAAAYLRLAHLQVVNGQPDSALAQATRGEEIARALGDRALLASALASRAHACMMVSRADEALRAAEEAAELSRPENDWWPCHMLAWIYEERGEYERGRQAAERLLAGVERARDPRGLITAMSRLGLDAFLSGDWPAGRAYLERGLAVADETGLTAGHTYATPRLDLGRLLHAEGALDEAAAYFKDVLATFAGTGERVHALAAHAHLAEREMLGGQPEVACARLLPLLDRPGQEERMVTHFILPALAWAQLEAGQIDRAASTVSDALERARRGTCRLPWAQALRVQALVLLAQERWNEAELALEEGLTLTRSMPYPHGEGRLLEVYGRLRLARGDAAAAREWLEAALAIFRRLGARRDIEQTEQLLHSLG